MDFHQNTQPDEPNDQGQEPILNEQPANGPYQQAPTGGDPYQANPYGNNMQPQNQNRIPYGNQTPPQNQNQIPYGSQIPPQNQNPYYGNNQPYQSPYGNNGPYGNGYSPYPDNRYRQVVYPVQSAEPGSSLAQAAMVLGIITLIGCFTFTIYPAFILGSIAILLALLSKGRRPALIPKARTGIICATIGLVINTTLVTTTVVSLFTNEELRQEVNEIMEKQYGTSFDEMIEEIMEGNDY